MSNVVTGWESIDKLFSKSSRLKKEQERLNVEIDKMKSKKKPDDYTFSELVRLMKSDKHKR